MSVSTTLQHRYKKIGKEIINNIPLTMIIFYFLLQYIFKNGSVALCIMLIAGFYTHVLGTVEGSISLDPVWVMTGFLIVYFLVSFTWGKMLKSHLLYLMFMGQLDSNPLEVKNFFRSDREIVDATIDSVMYALHPTLVSSLFMIVGLFFLTIITLHGGVIVGAVYSIGIFIHLLFFTIYDSGKTRSLLLED